MDMTFHEKEEAEKMRPLNLQRCAEAMALLYKTYIIKDSVAKVRGEAIQAIQRMIDGLGGANLIAEIESVPFSKRLRDSGEPELVNLSNRLRNAVDKP